MNIEMYDLSTNYLPTKLTTCIGVSTLIREFHFLDLFFIIYCYTLYLFLFLTRFRIKVLYEIR